MSEPSTTAVWPTQPVLSTEVQKSQEPDDGKIPCDVPGCETRVTPRGMTRHISSSHPPKKKRGRPPGSGKKSTTSLPSTPVPVLKIEVIRGMTIILSDQKGTLYGATAKKLDV